LIRADPTQAVTPVAAKQLPAIYGMFFLSGLGALVFETVWFSQTGLVVGNTVWSAALVVGAFMAGLALGNCAATLVARRWRNLVRCYAVVEIIAAATGAALVIAFPYLPEAFSPMLAPHLGDTATLNLIRSAIAFGLMVIPSAALGTTLPLLSKPLEAATGSYALALGRLYGVNTLGAVAGTLVAELVLVPALGLRGSGLSAAACNLLAGLIALRISRSASFDTPPTRVSAFALDRETARTVGAAALAGAAFLALEVVWFRFLILFLPATALTFATMLAVILTGIGLGGIVAAAWSKRGWNPAVVARMAATGACIGAVAGYAGFDLFLRTAAGIMGASAFPVLLCAFLMGPVSLCSGVLFTALGDQLRSGIRDATAATGALTLANTLGGMAGSLLGAFVLLPVWGVERSWFVLAVTYAALTLLVPSGGLATARRWWPAALAAVVLAAYPFGSMVAVHHRNLSGRFDARLLEAREGVSETAFYLAHEFAGHVWYHRLATNSVSMSSTTLQAQRYMQLFAYLPAALHPRIERALVICFGVGVTASAVTDLPDVRAIDIVDVSRDILELSDLAYAARHPLRDPRVSVHVEDGRFFLQHTAHRFDLITGEPPPPKLAGIAALYSREYFELLRSRLNPGGLATYWVPAIQLTQSDAWAIVRAFCDAFPDCTLWSGGGHEWILMGSRDGIAAVPEERLARLWTIPALTQRLRGIGVDGPAPLAALFMADADLLRKLTAGTPPLADNFPRRLSTTVTRFENQPYQAFLMEENRSRAAFAQSAWIARVLPPSIIAASDADFRRRRIADDGLYRSVLGLLPQSATAWSEVAQLLRETAPTELPRWLLGSEARLAEIARRADQKRPELAETLAIDAVVERQPPPQGVERESFTTLTPDAQLVGVFHQCHHGRGPQARQLLAWIPEERRAESSFRGLSEWVEQACPLAQK
jgi:spermidine synthase